MSENNLPFSVVCVFNNREILEKLLLSSLEDQTCQHETILLDNREGKFPSAARAFNSALDRISGEYVIFAHQDISFGDPETLENILRMLQGLDGAIVAGVAGKAFKGKWIISNIKHGEPPTYAGKLRADKIEKVQTLDECLFIVSRQLLEKIRFDEAVCPGWHLYAVEYCLSVMHTAPVFVLPVEGIYHRSRGASMSDEYYCDLKKVAKKHRNSTYRIFTSCGRWFTDPLILNTQVLLKKTEKGLRKVFRPLAD